ncbi:uncharacterized protein LOC114294199 [Camellia sinensis]|uniref:uncharacterized protein LOC114294199 n=1 Tax=Camellia sinensis TaxID=4442 RepID=UPI001036899D|nr:uncharacterized protein LOC114294199 [Camellia sinensis]
MPESVPIPLYPNSVSMKLLIWNCRGVGNKIFRRTLKELVQNYKPSILALMETKVELNPVGKSGGIWILWDPFRATVKALEVNAQCIHAKIQRDNHSDWILSAIYASHNPRVRDNLWKILEAAADNMNHPWLVAWDFNNIASQGEKRSFSTNQSSIRTRKFNARLNRCNLMDLGCSGPNLTWSNGQQGLANTMERLDRAVCNTEWRLAFTEGAVKNLPRTYSDHSSMIVFTQGMNSPNLSARPFRLEAAWFTDSSFKNVVEKSWVDSHFSVPEAIDLLTKNALSWNKNSFGNIFRKKKVALG